MPEQIAPYTTAGDWDKQANGQSSSDFWRTTAWIKRGSIAFCPLGLFLIEMLVRFGKQFFDALAAAVVDGYADTRGEVRGFVVVSHDFSDAVGDATRFVFAGFRQNEGKFIAAVSRGSVNGAAVNPEDVGESADGAAADEMAVIIIDCFQAIEIEEQDGKRTAGAVGAFRLVFQNVEETAVVGETGEGIADGKMVDLFKEPRVVKKSPSERDGVAQHHKRLGKNEGSVQQARGLSDGELRGNV